MATHAPRKPYPTPLPIARYGQLLHYIEAAPQHISIDFPKNILEEVDIEAAKIGMTRNSLIKMWVAEHVSGSLHTK